MNEPITLVVLTGHKDTRPALVPLRRLEPDDLPELRRVQQHAYADGTAQPTDADSALARTTGVEGSGRTVEAASLVTSGPDGRSPRPSSSPNATVGRSSQNFSHTLITAAKAWPKNFSDMPCTSYMRWITPR